MAVDGSSYQPLDIAAIENALAAGQMWSRVFYRPELGSTNDIAADFARAGNADALVVLTEQQLSGRGKGDRRWLSPSGLNVLMSVVVSSCDWVFTDEALMMAAGLSVAIGCEQATGLKVGQCSLKWPNDVLLDGCKLAGILIERRVVPGGEAAVIGMGINVNSSPQADEVRLRPVSLSQYCGHLISREAIITAVLANLEEYAGQLSSNPAVLKSLRDQWSTRLARI